MWSDGLRQYQVDAIKALWQWWKENPDGHPLIIAPTGSGKSLKISAIVKRLLEKRPEYNVLIVSHRKEIIEQNTRKLQAAMPDRIIGVYSAGLKIKRVSRVTVANIQSIVRCKSLHEIHLLIVDECFTGSTKILTPKGPKRIDLMRCGDYVYSASGIGRVEAISRRSTNELISIEFSDGTKIKCTPNHPFFTEKGWIKAQELVKGRIAFSCENVRLLWERNASLEGSGYARSRSVPRSKKLGQAKVLLNILCKEIRESDAQCCVAAKNGQNASTVEASTYQERRKRAIATLTSASAFARARSRMGSRVISFNQSRSLQRRLSKSLQDRHSKFRTKNSHRSRRGISHDIGAPGTRSEKDQSFNFPRVVSVSRIKSKSPRTVFNLHISGHPSYFAEGKLVHNCHLLPHKSDSMYQKLISNLRSKNKYLKIVGLTATPYRLDQGHLIGEGSLFTDVAFDIEIPGLIKEKHLSNIRSKVSREQVNLTGIKTVGFDYDQKELAERFDSLTIKHCEEMIKLGQNRKSWIIFSTGISHAEHVSSCLKEMGVSADYISGEMMSMERDRKINDFKAGKIKALCNCDILTTGFDYPELDFLVLLRATKSTALYVQMVGRCMRPAEGKTDALVLDFGGNIFRHGPIDSISVSKKTKNGKAQIKKAPVKMCPSCGEVVAIRTLECACGYEFPLDTTKLTVKPDIQTSILSEPETLDVTWHNYRLHKKPGKPPSFKIEYGCGSRLFYDFFCFDHGGYATEMARKKWKVLFNMPPPADVFGALTLSADLPVPKTVVVRKVGDFWRVLEVVTMPKEKDFNPVEEIGINI